MKKLLFCFMAVVAASSFVPAQSNAQPPTVNPCRNGKITIQLEYNYLNPPSPISTMLLPGYYYFNSYAEIATFMAARNSGQPQGVYYTYRVICESLPWPLG